MHLNWNFPLLIYENEVSKGIAALQSPPDEGLNFSETLLHPWEGLDRLSSRSASRRNLSPLQEMICVPFPCFSKFLFPCCYRARGASRAPSRLEFS